jgi:anti-sigma B factor antagonist
MTDDLHSELTTSVDAQGGRAVVRAAGEVDLYTAPRFAEALEQAAEAAPRLLVDLTEVTFMDSTGLRCLLQARARAGEDTGAIALTVAEGSPVARLLDLAGVTEMFRTPENPA